MVVMSNFNHERWAMCVGGPLLTQAQTELLAL